MAGTASARCVAVACITLHPPRLCGRNHRCLLPPATGITIAAVPHHLRSFSSAWAMMLYNCLGYAAAPFICGLLAQVRLARPFAYLPALTVCVSSGRHLHGASALSWLQVAWRWCSWSLAGAPQHASMSNAVHTRRRWCLPVKSVPRMPHHRRRRFRNPVRARLSVRSVPPRLSQMCRTCGGVGACATWQ